MSDLKKQAEELGLKVDGRWSDDRLQEEIDKVLAGGAQGDDSASQSDEGQDTAVIEAERDAALEEVERLKAQLAAQAPAAPPDPAPVVVKNKTPMMPVTLLYDYWFEDDVRTPAGETVDVPVSDARALIAAGKAVRADPLPGE